MYNKLNPVNVKSLDTVIKGRRVRYLKAGSGPPVVLVHGGASSSLDWQPFMAKYAGLYTFFAPDLPGFGNSARDPKGYFLDDFSGFLYDFIESLKLEKPALVGHSFGGRVCLEALGTAGGNVSRLVLIDSSGLGKMSPFGHLLFYSFKWLRAILRKKQPFPIFLPSPGVDWNNISDEKLKNIRVPAMLIWKSFDPYLSVKQGKRAVKLIPGAEMAVINGYGHAPHKQKDNSLCCKLMLDFLGREA